MGGTAAEDCFTADRFPGRRGGLATPFGEAGSFGEDIRGSRARARLPAWEKRAGSREGREVKDVEECGVRRARQAGRAV